MPKHTKSSRPKTVISWQFAKGAQALTCRVDAAGRARSFSVAVLPHWDVTRAAVEHVVGVANALARHACVVSSLRDAGWRVVSHTY
ncbi:MAG TPA: hypothetical protein VIX35_12630 [Vicinamibacterales bacterium]